MTLRNGASDPSTAVFGELRELLAPHCWAVPQLTITHDSTLAPVRIEVEVILKSPLGASTPSEVRAGLFTAAQAAIAAVEGAGYQHFRAPEIRIDGEACNVYTADGPTLVTEGRLRLVVRRPSGEGPR